MGVNVLHTRLLASHVLKPVSYVQEELEIVVQRSVSDLDRTTHGRLRRNDILTKGMASSRRAHGPRNVINEGTACIVRMAKIASRCAKGA